MELPWCAAKRCPEQFDCQGYTFRNGSNQDLLPLTACCKVLCGGAGSSKVGILALQCGGLSSATAIVIVLYIVVLCCVAACMVLLGSFLCLKRPSSVMSSFGTLIFTTVTGVYVTYLTSPLKYVDAVPAVGAMNIAIFSYFFSGFQYSIGVAHEAGPLVALLTTAYSIWRAILKSPEDGPFLRDSNRISLTMLTMAFIWVLHSVSYRILGYRVEWRISNAPRRKEHDESLNMCYSLGAAQGHPTWRTPVGQSTSVLLMVLAWVLQVAVRNDLAKRQQCRADWVLGIMLWFPPWLITGAVGYNLLSALRNRKVVGIQNMRDPEGLYERFTHWIATWFYDQDRRGGYPGWNMYKTFSTNGCLEAYKKAVALHRRGRNTYFIEDVTPLEGPDRLIGFSAWLLAWGGLVISFPVMLVMYVLTGAVGKALEALPSRVFRWFVTTTVTPDEHLKGAYEVVREAYVGENFDGSSKKAPDMNSKNEVTRSTVQRFINLPYLLDNIAHEELHVLLNT